MSEVHFNTLPQWLEWIESSHPVDKIELGLDRVRTVFLRMGLDLSGSQKVIVGGTNGKGSTIAMLDQVLRDQGETVGCFTSPHFLRYNERIKLNGQPVSDELIIRAFMAVERARDQIPLTYFEYNTLAALHVFSLERPNVMLLEVGLGGRLDAINIVDADISVVTTVSVDHIDWLGDDREKIGYEKAGIYRQDRPAVCGDAKPPQQLVAYAKDIGAELYLRDQAFTVIQENQNSWTWQSKQADGTILAISGLPELTLPKANGATVIQVLQLLDRLPQPAQLGSSLKSASLTGRMQAVTSNGVDYILDVAHNPEAAEYLSEQLRLKPVKGRTLMVLGMLADKDIDEVLNHLTSVVDHWYLAGLNVPRGQTAEALGKKLKQQGVVVTPESAYDTVRIALNTVKAEAKPDDRVVVAGSFFTVAEALTTLNMDDKN